ncbi:MAG: zinc metallopeptidase [Pirellulales bacterium]|nr:zinc metallopeptidase [Pirellulales bacterium]
MFFDPMYFVFLAPALLLALWARTRMMSAYNDASQMPAPLSGAAAARYILDSAGLHHVGVEAVPGQLSDHYDPTAKALRLSQPNFVGRSLSAVGIAAHEAGHAIQDAERYAPLVIRNLAVPAANFGGSGGIGLMLLGAVMQIQPLIWAGLGLFSVVALFQIINLPVEYDASARAKRILVDSGIVPSTEMPHINKVLNAAALTYVAGTLESILTVAYYAMIFLGGGRSQSEE